jgi:hypothetical protein
VDLCLQVAGQRGALVEVKWSRAGLQKGMSYGRRSLGWLRRACLKGRWRSSRKTVGATMVGVLVVTPSSWQMMLQGLKGGGASWYRADIKTNSANHESTGSFSRVWGRCPVPGRLGERFRRVWGFALSIPVGS